MKATTRAGLGSVATLAAVMVVAIASAAAPSRPPDAPRFPSGASRWIGTPATWKALKGRVVLLDVWTFG
jgi:hypothetical protein